MFRGVRPHYTNAALIIDRDFRDTEDLDGLFSGFDPEQRQLRHRHLAVRQRRADAGASPERRQDQQARRTRRQRIGHAAPAQRDPTLQDPNCVFQIVKRHFARYTPEMVERACGVPRDALLSGSPRRLPSNSGRERTTVFAYAVAWTQHTTGTQMIGCCALLQLLLGNIGRPGGGIMALRGHATIQGSTDIPTLYNLLPGYLADAQRAQATRRCDGFPRRRDAAADRLLVQRCPKYMVSLLKAWYGDARHSPTTTSATTSCRRSPATTRSRRCCC